MGIPWRFQLAPRGTPSRKKRLTPEERLELRFKRVHREMEELRGRLEKVEALAQGTADELERPLSPEEAKAILEETENDA